MERKLTKAERKDRRNKELCILAKENDLYAQTRLLLENEGLIVQLAKSLELAHELDINHYGGIELDDILQEGRFAMLEAAMQFETIERTAAFFHTTEGIIRELEKNALAKLRDGMNDGKII